MASVQQTDPFALFPQPYIDPSLIHLYGRGDNMEGQPSKRKRSQAEGMSSTSASGTGSPLSASSSAYRPFYKPLGRLGEPRMELFQDPRLNPRLLAALSQYGLDRNVVPPALANLSPASSLEEIQTSMAEAAAGMEVIYDSMPNDLPADAYEIEVERFVQHIAGYDNSGIRLCIYRPALRGPGALPCVIYLHGGGGMNLMREENKVHRRWYTSLAASGVVCISVDYQNSRSSNARFPGGLEDACAAINYIHAHRDDFNIRNIVLQGEGGGANLCMAATLKAKQENWLNKIDGVYACSPCISNAYSWSEERKLRELPSLIECQGYRLNVDYLAYMAHVYTPRSVDSMNPLSWPYHASVEDLQGLPPHVLAMDELDPLRSEGEMYGRKLAEAGVQCVAHVNLGVTHAASLIFRKALPESHRAAVRDISAFARSV